MTGRDLRYHDPTLDFTRTSLLCTATGTAGARPIRGRAARIIAWFDSELRSGSIRSHAHPHPVSRRPGDPVRRRILQLLADGKPRAASQIAPSVSRRTDATLKPLVALRHAGLLELSIDPVDSRRQLYALSLKVPVTRTEKGTELDFGCCVARVGR